MSNNFFCVLIICAFTGILTENEEEKPAWKEVVNHTRKLYEEEAKKDIKNLLSRLKSRNFSEEDKDDTEPLNIDASRSHKIMEIIEEILKKKNVRSTDQIMAEHFKRGVHMKNLPLYLRNPIKSGSNLYNSNANNNQFLQVMNRLTPPNSCSVKNRISGGHNVKNLLRNCVNFVNIKPEVYPVLIAEDDYGSKEISSEKDKQISNQYYADNEDELIKLANKVNTAHKNQSVIRTATIPITENLDVEELLNQLHIKRGEVISTRRESDNNFRLHDFLNKFYSQSTHHLRPGRVENAHNNLDKFEETIDLKDKTKFLRSDIIDEVNPNANGRLRTSHSTLSNGISPVKQGDRRGRQRRSTNTQAGYTQDPDTCKTYNGNLVRLWSYLSKLSNVTEKPNDRALHNIAMMIRAYLEHQNAKPPSQTHKEKHEGPRDKISEVMLKIRKLLEVEGSAEKITKIIIKYLKPVYTDAEIEDCQEINEEYLGLSVNLLYKNYLENTDCESDDDSMVKNEKLSLREKKVKTGKLSLATSDLKPEIRTVLIENELYSDFHKEKMPRQRPTSHYRRVFKPSRNKRSRPAYRSGNQNENLQTRPKTSPKFSRKKLKKISLKSNLVKSKCEKYLTRKLIISLRSVMERFMGLLECQLDHTLRSVRFGKDSKNPYYVYASKSPRLLEKTTGPNRNKSHKKVHTIRHDSSVEHDRDVHERDDETDSAWVKKYSSDQMKGMNSGTPAVARDTDARESDTENKQYGNSDYLTTYNEYFQSPPLYDDYDGTYKTYQVTNLNGFSSLINTLISLNDKKNIKEKPANQKLTLSDKEQDKENYKNDESAYLEESFSEESNHPFNFVQQTESDIIEEPFIDFTKLRNDDQLIEEKSKAHVKSFESITEFLKKARDASLQTPEFSVPFALDTNKGYVELTHLIKHPKMLMYRPQFLVKNTMPYDDFLKIINDINMTNDDVRLMKIVRHLPDGSVQVLFETEDFEAPLEVRNLKDNRGISGSPDSVANHRFESRMETGIENADFTDGDSKDYIPIYRNEASKKFSDVLVKSDSFSIVEDASPENPDSKTLKAKEEHSFDYDSDTNLNSKLSSSESSSSLWLSSESGKAVGSAVGSALGSQKGSGMQPGSDTALNLGIKLTPHSSQLGSFFSKLLPSDSNMQSTLNPSLNPQSHANSHSDSSSGSLSASNSQLNSDSVSWSNSNSGSHSLLPYTDSSNKEVGNNFCSSTKSIWWRKWKNIVKRKMKSWSHNESCSYSWVEHPVESLPRCRRRGRMDWSVGLGGI